MPAGLRVTPRDLLIIGFLARYRVCTYTQLSAHLGTSESSLRNRLPRLEAAGFVNSTWTGMVTATKLWTCTSQGLRAANLDLPTPQVSWGTVQHTLGLVDLGIHFERDGELVVTEREIRASTSFSTPTPFMLQAIQIRERTIAGFGNVYGAPDATVTAQEGYTVKMMGRQSRHIPDMVLVRQPFPDGRSGSIAIELELTRKTLSDWKAILSAYRDSSVFHQVVYYVPSPELEKALTATIASLGADHKIHVLRWQPSELAADPTRR